MENKNLNTVDVINLASSDKYLIAEPFQPQTAGYDTHLDTLNAFLEHSKGKGNGTVLGNVQGLNRHDREGGRRVTFACDRHGTYQKRINEDVHTSKRRKTTSSQKCGCLFCIEAIEDPITKKWHGNVYHKYHNHPPSSEVTSHPVHRHTALKTMASPLKERIQDMATHKVPIFALQAQLENEGILVVKKDLYNLNQAHRNTQLGGLTAVQWLKDKLKRGEWFHKFDTSTHEDNTRVMRIFFAHPESINFLKKAPEVLLLDCTYKTNRFNMPLLNICASLGDGMTLQVALAFLSGKKEPDYTWALNFIKRHLEVHKIATPKFFVTDRE